eukprot:gene2103-3053_t
MSENFKIPRPRDANTPPLPVSRMFASGQTTVGGSPKPLPKVRPKGKSRLRAAVQSAGDEGSQPFGSSKRMASAEPRHPLDSVNSEPPGSEPDQPIFLSRQAQEADGESASPDSAPAGGHGIPGTATEAPQPVAGSASPAPEGGAATNTGGDHDPAPPPSDAGGDVKTSRSGGSPAPTSLDTPPDELKSIQRSRAATMSLPKSDPGLDDSPGRPRAQTVAGPSTTAPAAPLTPPPPASDSELDCRADPVSTEAILYLADQLEAQVASAPHLAGLVGALRAQCAGLERAMAENRQAEEQQLQEVEEGWDAMLEQERLMREALEQQLAQAKTALVQHTKLVQHYQSPEGSQDRITERLSNLGLPADALVHLNVGGTLFTTLASTLLRDPDSYFENLLAQPAPAPGQPRFIDRSARFFTVLLEYLRTGILDLDPGSLTRADRQALARDIHFYRLHSLLRAPRPATQDAHQSLLDKYSLSTSPATPLDIITDPPPAEAPGYPADRPSPDATAAAVAPGSGAGPHAFAKPPVKSDPDLLPPPTTTYLSSKPPGAGSVHIARPYAAPGAAPAHSSSGTPGKSSETSPLKFAPHLNPACPQGQGLSYHHRSQCISQAKEDSSVRSAETQTHHAPDWTQFCTVPAPSAVVQHDQEQHRMAKQHHHRLQQTANRARHVFAISPDPDLSDIDRSTLGDRQLLHSLLRTQSPDTGAVVAGTTAASHHALGSALPRYGIWYSATARSSASLHSPQGPSLHFLQECPVSTPLQNSSYPGSPEVPAWTCQNQNWPRWADDQCVPPACNSTRSFNYGFITFDSLPNALLTMFPLISLDNWGAMRHVTCSPATVCNVPCCQPPALIC